MRAGCRHATVSSSDDLNPFHRRLRGIAAMAIPNVIVSAAVRVINQ